MDTEASFFGKVETVRLQDPFLFIFLFFYVFFSPSSRSEFTEISKKQKEEGLKEKKKERKNERKMSDLSIGCCTWIIRNVLISSFPSFHKMIRALICLLILSCCSGICLIVGVINERYRLIPFLATEWSSPEAHVCYRILAGLYIIWITGAVCLMGVIFICECTELMYAGAGLFYKEVEQMIEEYREHIHRHRQEENVKEKEDELKSPLLLNV